MAWWRDRVQLVGALVFGAAVGSIAITVARVGAMQSDPDDRLRDVIGRREVEHDLPARRGNLLDRRGRIVSTTRPLFRIVLDPMALGDAAHESIGRIADCLGVSPGEIGAEVMMAQATNAQRAAARRAAGLLDDEPKLTEAERKAEARRRLIEKLGTAADALLGEPPARETSPRVLGVAGTTETRAPTPGALPTDAASEQAVAPLPRLIRYLPLVDDVEPEHAAAIEAMKLPGVWLERRPRRAPANGSLLEPVVGKVSAEGRGVRGLELALDPLLSGTPGSVRAVVDSGRSPIWMGPDAVRQPRHGADIALSIDLELQRIAAEELFEGVTWADGAGGRVLILDPASGSVLAMATMTREVRCEPFPWIRADGVDPQTLAERRRVGVDWSRRYRVLPPADPSTMGEAALAHNRCIESIYEPGSTFKAFVWAEAARLGKAPAGEVYDKTPGWKRLAGGTILRDSNTPDLMTWDVVLSRSSNLGMVALAERLSTAQLRRAVLRLGFGSPTGLELEREEAGLVPSARDWKQVNHQTISYGQGIAVTPIQLARAFCTFARDGAQIGTLPRVSLVADASARAELERRLGSNGADAGAAPDERIWPAEVVHRVREALTRTAEDMDSKARHRFPDYQATYHMFGKSGTAQIPIAAPQVDPEHGERKYVRPYGVRGYLKRQYFSSFVAAAPSDAPRLVVLVLIEDPGPELVARNSYYGSAVAGPVVRRIVERALRYLGVEPPPDPESKTRPAPAGADQRPRDEAPASLAGIVHSSGIVGAEASSTV